MEGLTQRVEDKAQEVAGLSHQLALSQQNLEHYRETVRAQRDQERADSELQRRTWEQSLHAAREEIHALRTTQHRLEGEHTAAQAEEERLHAELAAVSGQRDALAEAAQGTARRLAELEGLHQGLSQAHHEAMTKVETLSDRAIFLERQAAIDQEKIRTMEGTLAKANDTIESLRHDNLFLRQEKANLEGQFKVLERGGRA